jgi:hypothetical protein
VTTLLAAPQGLPATAAALAQADGLAVASIEAKHILTMNVAAEMAERALELKYPVVSVYCEKSVNTLREKFRTFSGSIRLAVEVRATHDRLEGLAAATQLYAEAVAGVLDENRGNWGDGMFFTGQYEIEFGPIKRGGRGFLQTAKVSFEIQASR